MDPAAEAALEGAAPPPRERAPIGFDPALVSDSTLLATRQAPAAYGGDGYVRVVTQGGSARVRVDGRRFGFSPQLLRLDAGRHVVTVEGGGDAFLPSQLTVDVTAGDTASAVFSAPALARPRADSAPGASAEPRDRSAATAP